MSEKAKVMMQRTLRGQGAPHELVEVDLELLFRQAFSHFVRVRIEEQKKAASAVQSSDLDVILEEALKEFKQQSHLSDAHAQQGGGQGQGREKAAFEKRGVKLCLFQRVRDLCEARGAEVTGARYRGASAAGCLRYVVIFDGVLRIRKGLSLTTDVVRKVSKGDSVIALPGSTTLEDGEFAGYVRVQLFDGTGWASLSTHTGERLLQLVGPATHQDFVIETGYWNISRVGAVIVGNHEILRTEEKDEALARGETLESVYRWGNDVDASTTLTLAGKCSLIEMIRQGHFEAPHASLGGNLRYDDVVGAKANIFVSFAYSSDFIEFVDSLECFFERTPSLDKNSTFFWFDLFVNDQWAALEKTFEWWATTFKEAVEEIGHTVVVFLPWQAPIPLTRAWCLFEIASSKKLSIALSSKQVTHFQNVILSGKGMDAVTDSLCKIDLEKATAYVPADKEKIFRAVRALEGGFHGLNVNVSGKMREWVQASLEEFVLEAKSTTDLMNLCGIYYQQGKLAEAEQLLIRILRYEEFVFGPDASMSDSVRAKLALINMEQGRYREAEALYMQTLQSRERVVGPNHESTLNLVHNLGNLYTATKRFVEAETMLKRALHGREVLFGPQSKETLEAVFNLGSVYEGLNRSLEAQSMYQKALQGYEKMFGAAHADTIRAVGNLSAILLLQGKFAEAEPLMLRALQANERIHGFEHPSTITVLYNAGNLYLGMRRFVEAEDYLSKSLLYCEKVYEPDYHLTLRSCDRLGYIYSKTSQLEKAQQMYTRVLRGWERTLGRQHPKTKEAERCLMSVQQKSGIASTGGGW